MDHYETLGVSRSASASEIKKSYRKLASQHHPDKGGDANKFKEIQKAYETLSNPERKQMYDQFGTDDPQQFQQGGFGGFQQDFDLGDIFDGVFGHRARPTKNPDSVANVHVNWSDAYNGGDIIIEVNGKRLNVHIPAGTRDLTKIRLHQQGHSRIRELPPGDLIVRVHIQYPHNMERHNDDVYMPLDITSIDAITGNEVMFSHFTGKRINLKIPKGSQTDSKLRLSGYGFPNPQTGVKGNCFVILRIVTPNITNEEHLEWLNIINNEVKNINGR